MDHGFLCPVEQLGGLLLFGFGPSNEPETWAYRPSTETWTRLRTGGEQPEFPMDHGQAASDGEHLFLLGGFGGPDVPPGVGLTPRGAMWRL